MISLKHIAVVTIVFIALDSLLVISSSQYILRKLESQRNDWLAGDHPKHQYRFFALVPLYKEARIIKDVFSNFKALGNREDCYVIFITTINEVPFSRRESLVKAVDNMTFHVGGHSTPELLHNLFYNSMRQDALPSNFRHVINETGKVGKYSQLNTGLDFLQSDITSKDIIAVYDADSHPDPQALEMIKSLNKALKAYQQLPLYPPAFPPRDLSQLLAHSKVLNDFCYTLTRLALPYHKSARTPQHAGSHSHIVCLTGHGEFIKWQTLQEAGGFLPPSCDSSLGFALGLKGIGIQPLPVVDLASTPNSVWGVYRQGIVWYNGITLMNRERKRLKMGWSLPALISYCKRINDNLKWGLYPFVILAILSLVTLQFPIFGTISIILAITNYILRDIFSWTCYHQMIKWMSRTPPNSIPLWYWMVLSLAYVLFTRWIWALVPWSVFFSRMLFGRVFLKKTSRK